MFFLIGQLIPNYKNRITEYRLCSNRFFLNSCKVIAIWSTHRHFGQRSLVRPLSWSWSKPVRVAISDTAGLVATHWCQSHKSWFMCDLRVLPVCTEILRMFVSTFPLLHQNLIWPDLWCRIKRAYRAPKPNERHKRSLLPHASDQRYICSHLKWGDYSQSLLKHPYDKTQQLNKKKVTRRFDFPSSGVLILLSCAFSCAHFWLETKRSSRMLKANEGMV